MAKCLESVCIYVLKLRLNEIETEGTTQVKTYHQKRGANGAWITDYDPITREHTVRQDAYNPINIVYYDINKTTADSINYSSVRGRRFYELTNHLGNVMATVSDVKYQPTTFFQRQQPAPQPIVHSVNHYYPFGMTLPNRNYNASDYKYGFNGMEKDDEVKGSGNSYDFGARIYDGRIGRWLSLDNYEAEYPYASNYSSFLNNPVLNIDVNGDYVLSHKIDKLGNTYSEMKIMTPKRMKRVNVITAIPLLGLPMTLAKTIHPDPTVEFEGSDAVGVMLNLIGAGVAKYADDIGKSIIEVSRTGVSAIGGAFADDNINAEIDTRLIHELEKQGLGKVKYEIGFGGKEKKESGYENQFVFSDEFRNNVESNVKNDFLGTKQENCLSCIESETQNRIKGIVEQVRDKVKEDVIQERADEEK